MEESRPAAARLRAAAVGVAIAIAVVALVAAVAVDGDGGDGDSNAGGKSAPTTTIPNTPKFPPAGEEFVLRPGAPDLRVRLGDRITFAMGDAGDGEWTAASEDPAVIWIERSGSRDGTPNAGGRAVGLGETEVLVQYRGEPPRPSARFAIRVGER